MSSCRECGEDLGLTWNGISKCENKVCDLYFEKDQVADLNKIIRECETDLTNNGCLDAYINQ